MHFRLGWNYVHRTSHAEHINGPAVMSSTLGRSHSGFNGDLGTWDVAKDTEERCSDCVLADSNPYQVERQREQQNNTGIVQRVVCMFSLVLIAPTHGGMSRLS